MRDAGPQWHAVGPRFPRGPDTRSTPGGPVRDIAAEKNTVLATAQQLRHDAIQDRYAGSGPPDWAFGLASVLDLLAVKWVDLDDDLRTAVLALPQAPGE